MYIYYKVYKSDYFSVIKMQFSSGQFKYWYLNVFQNLGRDAPPSFPAEGLLGRTQSNLVFILTQYTHTQLTILVFGVGQTLLSPYNYPFLVGFLIKIKSFIFAC